MTGDEVVAGPHAALVAGDDPGVHPGLEMVGDGRLVRPRGSVSPQTQASPPACGSGRETHRRLSALAARMPPAGHDVPFRDLRRAPSIDAAARAILE
jgi:hypothetical protein